MYSLKLIGQSWLAVHVGIMYSSHQSLASLRLFWADGSFRPAKSTWQKGQAHIADTEAAFFSFVASYVAVSCSFWTVMYRNLDSDVYQDCLMDFACSSTLFSSSTTSPGSILRSSDQLHEVISLADAMLSSVQPSTVIILKDQPSVADLAGGTSFCQKFLFSSSLPDFVAFKNSTQHTYTLHIWGRWPAIQAQESCAGEEQASQSEDVAARRKFLADNPELLYQYSSNLLSLLLQVYHGTVVQQVLTSQDFPRTCQSKPFSPQIAPTFQRGQDLQHP